MSRTGRFGLVERIEDAIVRYHQRGRRISQPEMEDLLELLSEANQRIIDTQRQLYRIKRGL